MGLMFITGVTFVNLILITHLNGDIAPHKVVSTDKIYDKETKDFLDEISAIHYSVDIERDKKFLLSLIKSKRFDQRKGEYTYLHYNYIRKYMREIFSEISVNGVFGDYRSGLNISLSNADGINTIYPAGLPHISECKNSNDHDGNDVFPQIGVRFGKYLVEPFKEHPYRIYYSFGVTSMFGIGTFVGYYVPFGIVGIERTGAQEFNIYAFAFHDETVVTTREANPLNCKYYNSPLQMTVCKKNVKFALGTLVQFLLANVDIHEILVYFLHGDGGLQNMASFDILQDIYETNSQSHTAFIDSFVTQGRCCSNYTNQVYLFDPIYVPDIGVDYGTEYPLHNQYVETYEYGPNNCSDEARGLYTELVPFNMTYLTNYTSYIHNGTYNSIRISRGWSSLMF